MTFWRSTPALLALLTFTYSCLFVPAAVVTVWWDGGDDSRTFIDMVFMLAWHAVVAPSFVWYGATCTWTTFTAVTIAVATLPLLFLSNVLARTMYGLAGLVLLGGRESFPFLARALQSSVFLMAHMSTRHAFFSVLKQSIRKSANMAVAWRHTHKLRLVCSQVAADFVSFVSYPFARLRGDRQPAPMHPGTAMLRRGACPCIEVRDSLLARLVWCTWYQDLSEATPVASKFDADAELRTVVMRATRVAVFVPVSLCGVLWFANDRPFYAPEVFLTSTLPRVWFSGALFAQMLEMMDIAYTLPPLLVAEPVRVPSPMRQPFLADSLADFWGMKWNNAIQRVLYHSIHRPVKEATHSGSLAAMATFAASALVHVYGVAVAGASHDECAMVVAFFFTQALFITAERHVLSAVSRKGQGAARWGRVTMWTGIMLSSCMFYVPVVRLAGLGWP